jgi:hypothetical protein
MFHDYLNGGLSLFCIVIAIVSFAKLLKLTGRSFLRLSSRLHH